MSAQEVGVWLGNLLRDGRFVVAFIGWLRIRRLGVQILQGAPTTRTARRLSRRPAPLTISERSETARGR